MSITGSVEVLVTPEVLIEQAEEVRRLGNDMKIHFQEMESIMNKTRNYWIGEAGDIHRQRYEEHKDDIDQMLRRLLEHPDDLLMISGNYSAAEKSNVEAALALPEDIIS